MNDLLFEDVLEKKLHFFKDKNILVAFSGGKDSLALVDFFNLNKVIAGYKLFACHVNHGLRNESGEDEEFCRTWCLTNGVEFFSSKLEGINDHKNISCGVEDWARKERYKALKDVALKIGADYILTAHTFDDKLESFFVDLYTGASIFTLGGISFLRENICRPMLEVRTAQVENYLLRRGLTSIFDKSNNDMRFVRNKVRQKIMPVFFEMGDDFVKTVLRLQEESAALNENFELFTSKAIISKNEFLTVIDKKIFERFSAIEQTYLLSKIFSERFRFSKSIVNEALKLLTRKGSKRIDLPKNFIFEVSFNEIKIFKKNLIDLFKVEKDERTDTITALDMEVKFYGKYKTLPLVIRNRRSGDKFHGKKLKDIFIDASINLFDRDRALIIENKAGHILHILCVGNNSCFDLSDDGLRCKKTLLNTNEADNSREIKVYIDTKRLY